MSDLKAVLVEIVNWAADEERRITESTWDQAAPTTEDWNARDIVWHLAAWRRQMASSLSNLCHGTNIAVRPGDDDTDNPVIFREGRDQSPDSIRRVSRSTVDDLVNAIQSTSEACLNDRLPGPWRADEQAWEAIVGSSCDHVLEHMRQLLMRTADVAQILDLHRQQAELYNKLPPGRPKTLSRYNLACFYSVNGDADQALAVLKDVLPDSPYLREFAKEDPDLDALREHAEFQQLVGVS